MREGDNSLKEEKNVGGGFSQGVEQPSPPHYDDVHPPNTPQNCRRCAAHNSRCRALKDHRYRSCWSCCLSADDRHCRYPRYSVISLFGHNCNKYKIKYCFPSKVKFEHRTSPIPNLFILHDLQQGSIIIYYP